MLGCAQCPYQCRSPFLIVRTRDLELEGIAAFIGCGVIYFRLGICVASSQRTPVLRLYRVGILRVVELDWVFTAVVPVGHGVFDGNLAVVVHQAANGVVGVALYRRHIDIAGARLVTEGIVYLEDVFLSVGSRSVPATAVGIRVLEGIERCGKHGRVVCGVLSFGKGDVVGQCLCYLRSSFND